MYQFLESHRFHKFLIAINCAIHVTTKFRIQMYQNVKLCLIFIVLLCQYLPIIDQYLVNSWPMLGQHLANTWPILGQCLANSRDLGMNSLSFLFHFLYDEFVISSSCLCCHCCLPFQLLQ